MITTRHVVAGVIIMILLIAGCIIENWRDRRRMTREEHQAAQAWFLAASAGFLILVLLLALFAHPVHAHDHSRPELDGWFMSLESKGKSPCCDGSDALRLDDVDWETKDGHYRVRLQGEWVDVPDSAVVEGAEPRRPNDGLAVLSQRGDARGTLLHAGVDDMTTSDDKPLLNSCAECPTSYRCYAHRRCYISGRYVMTVSEALASAMSSGHEKVTQAVRPSSST